MNIFLGNPPENIKQWIIEHYAPPTPAAGPLCFTAEQDGSSVSLIGWDDGMYDQIDIFASLQYSIDNSTWQEWDGHVINLAAGEKVYIKALNSNPSGMARDNGMKYHKFVFEGKIAASGSIQYLLEDTGSRTDVPAYAYNHLFAGVEDPETYEMTSALTQAPALPATTLADSCYKSMFSGCSNLTQAPTLPATTVVSLCYSFMFSNCSNLTQAPELPATALATNCYYSMFNSCTKVTELHYPASIQNDSTFTGMSGSPKFGATNATVHYDL